MIQCSTGAVGCGALWLALRCARESGPVRSVDLLAVEAPAAAASDGNDLEDGTVFLDRPAMNTKCPLLGPWLGIIDQILMDDQSQPKKQRHTATKGKK